MAKQRIYTFVVKVTAPIGEDEEPSWYEVARWIRNELFTLGGAYCPESWQRKFRTSKVTVTSLRENGIE